ncbi:hypothetical protein AURDEDRAFT_160673 [Auricularia subglabra TFB-10046 SS5]|nr:hypothetical protein AURDEDRAFT_160673 [Auricularia subglabra TFB-10046 SS5]
MSTILAIIWDLLGRLGGFPTDPASLVRYAIDYYLYERVRELSTECYPSNAPLAAIPVDLVGLELLALPPVQPPAPLGFSVDGGHYEDLFDYIAETMHAHIGASAALEPLAREAHTMRVIWGLRDQLNGIVDTCPGSTHHSSHGERGVLHTRNVLGLASRSVLGGLALRLSLDAAVSVLSCCKSLREVQNWIFAFPHWAQAGAFVTEITLRTRESRRQAEACALFNRLPNLRGLALDAGLRNSAEPRRPAARIADAVLDLGKRTLWTTPYRYAIRAYG